MTVTPTPRRNYWLFLIPATFLALAVLLNWGFSRDASLVPSVLIGKPAPDLTLPPLPGLMRDNQPLPGLSRAALQGSGVTVVNVFASWCVPCRQEHPALLAFAREGKARLFGINQKDDPAKAAAFLAELGNPYAAIGVDPTGRAGIEWGVYGVPETFVLNGEGVIVEKFVGPIATPERYTALEKAVERAGQR